MFRGLSDTTRLAILQPAVPVGGPWLREGIPQMQGELWMWSRLRGAFIAARLNRLPVRQSAALVTLMNTRGLTELIVLNVGLQMGLLGQDLYSLMVVMAVVTTAMAGPLLTLLVGRPGQDDDRLRVKSPTPDRMADSAN